MYNVLTDMERIKFMREAGDVQRLHVIRTIGEYSNAQHSFNMLAMLRLFWVEAPIELVWAIVEHDIPERLIGDIPSPSIHHVLQNSAGDIQQKENDVLQELFGFQYFVGLDPELMKWLKALDIFELYLYGRDQMKLGNQNLSEMCRRIEERIIKNASSFPPAIFNAFHEIKRSDWNHMPDLGV